MITDVIRNSNTEHEVFFLLNAYVETARFGDKYGFLPDAATTLPLHDAPEVRSRFEALFFELDTASRNLDDQSCVVLREAIHVFGTALDRLVALQRHRQHQLAA